MSTDADLGYNSADYADYFLEPPTDDQLEALEAAQEHALGHPLNEGDVLIWSGPNLHPESLPPTDYPHNTPPEPTPNAPRPLLRHLAGLDSPAQGGRSWSLRLVDGVQTGEGHHAQIWRCKVTYADGDEPEGLVILKLYQQSLFPLPDEWTSAKPDQDSFSWYPARHAVERESMAYRLLRGYQGRDVPLYYGFYRFSVPSGEDVVGVVLEDLVDHIVPFARLARGGSASYRLTLEQLDEMTCTAFEHQRRLHNAGLLGVAHDLRLVSALRDGWSQVLSIGFSGVHERDTLLRIHAANIEQDNAEKGAVSTKFCGWMSDQYGLWNGMYEVFGAMGQDFRRWRSTEKQRGRLSFPEMHF